MNNTKTDNNSSSREEEKEGTAVLLLTIPSRFYTNRSSMRGSQRCWCLFGILQHRRCMLSLPVGAIQQQRQHQWASISLWGLPATRWHAQKKLRAAKMAPEAEREL